MENVISITPSLMLEYNYCPRFIYFMKVLHIPQREENRFKVMKGREIHEMKELTNREYLRKKISVKQKMINIKLYSQKSRMHGIVDEILFLEDETAAPLDYKFAEYKEKLFHTHLIQLGMYAIMIEENFQISVNRGYLVYTRSKNHIEEIKLTKEKLSDIGKEIVDILKIIEKGVIPGKTRDRKKCNDCCYAKICV